MPEADYYRSERFIWDALRTQVEKSITSIYKTWRDVGRVDPFFTAWPSETILNELGLPDDGPQATDLPADRSAWSEKMLTFLRDKKAYAILLAEQKATEVLVILESHHGTQSWTFPILVSGDLRRLGDAILQRDKHRIGLLWQPIRAGG